MRKTMLYMMIFVLAVLISRGMDECWQEISSGSSCIVTTPKISCSTYDIYNDTNQLTVDDGSLSQIGTTGIYNFTFSLTPLGRYTIILCSNDTSYLNVVSVSDSTKIGNIVSNVSDMQSDLSNILVGVQSNASSITGILNANFTMTSAKLDALLGGISSNTSFLNSVLALNFTQIYTRFSYLDTNFTEVDTTLTNINTYLTSNFTKIYSEFNILKTGMATNSTWVTNNVNVTVVGSSVWGHNLTAYNTTADLHSAGAYLKAIEEYGYAR